jgi:hypothetical protein
MLPSTTCTTCWPRCRARTGSSTTRASSRPSCRATRPRSIRKAAAAAVERLRDELRATAPDIGFRLYRTAAGLRALAVDREFDPAGPEAQALMQRTGTDEAFARLCRSQESFRARLTPKHWRCACPKPPGEHPRTDERSRQEFAAWCQRYERAVEKHATCRYLETVGSGTPLPVLAPLIQLHDQATRCSEPLPLA